MALFLLIASALLYTSLFLNNKSLSWAQSKYLPEYKVPWDKLDFSIHSESIGEYKVLLQGGNFCIEVVKNTSEYCFENIDASFKVGLLPKPYYEILNVSVKSDKIWHELAKSESRESEINIYDMNQLFQSSLRLLEQYEFKKINLDLNNIKIISSDGKEKLVKIKLNTEGGQLLANLKDSQTEANIDLQRTEKPKWQGLISVDSEIINLKSNIQLVISEKIEIQTTNYLKLNKSNDFMASNIKLNLNYTGSEEVTQLELPLLNLQFKANEGYMQPSCNLTIKDEDELPLLCDIDIFTKIPEQKKPPYLKVSARMNSKLKNLIVVADEPYTFFELNTALFNADKSFLDIDGEINASASISNKGLELNLKKVHLLVDINQYKKILGFLSQFNVLVPAPFQSLEGSMRLELTGFKRLKRGQYELPILLKANLDKAKHNQLLMNAKGIYKSSASSSGFLKADVNIDKLYFYLPNIDPIQGLPPLKTDPRIQKEISDSKSEKSDFKYQISIKTKSNESVRVYYNLIDPYLSFGLKARLAENISYEISKGSHPSFIEYLKRRLQLTELNAQT